MPWTEMLFRGRDRVWVLTDDVGQAVVNDGRVTMKYKPDEAAKAYSAAAANIGTTAGPGAPSAPSGQNGKTQAGSTKPANSGTSGPTHKTSFDELIWKTPAGEIVSSTEEPSELADEDRPAAGIFEFYTDGACSGNPGRCGWGWVMRTCDGYVEARQFLGIGTNNIAELMAIKAALDHVDAAEAIIRIHTDSNYSLGVITKDWKAKANTELVDTIRRQMRGYKRRPEIIKVKGHAGDPLNERADFLATSSIRS